MSLATTFASGVWLALLCLSLLSCGSGKAEPEAPQPPVLDEDGRLPAPTNFSASQGSYPGGVLLSWDKVPGASGYAIGFADSDLEIVETGDVDSWVDSSIAPGEVRQYWLQALAEKRGRSTELRTGFRPEAAGQPGGSGGPGSFRGIDRFAEAASYPAPGGPALLWNANLAQETNFFLHGTLIADDGTIYASGYGALSAVSGEDGLPRWQVPGTAINTALGEDGTIYGQGDGYFFAMRPDGSLRWVRRCDEALLGLLYTGGGDDLVMRCNGRGLIYVLIQDARPDQLLGFSSEGELLWLIEAPEHNMNEMLLSPAGELVIVGDQAMSLVSPAGELKWTVQSEQGFSDPTYCLTEGIATVAEDGLVIYGYNGAVLRSMPLEGHSQWLTGHDGRKLVAVTEYDFVDKSRRLLTIDIASQQELWSRELDEATVQDCLFAADGKLLCNILEQLVCLDSSGLELWRYAVHERFSMALSGDGSLLLLREGGKLTALRSLDAPPPAPGGLSASYRSYADAVRIEWDIAPGALGYRVARGAPGQHIKFLGTQQSYIDETAPAEGAQYWISAFNEHGDGPPAGPVSGRPGSSVSGPAHWAQPGGDSAHSHRSELPGPQTYRRAWQFEFPQYGYFTYQLLVTDQGFVIAVDYDSIYCIDGAGRLLWSVQGSFDPESAVVAAGGRLYINDYDGELLAFERYGEPRELPYGSELGTISALGAGGELYLQRGAYDESGSISVLGADEELLSTIQIEGPGHLLAVGPDGRLYMELRFASGFSEYGSAAENRDLRVLESTGEELWSFDPQSLSLPLNEGETFIAARFDPDIRLDQQGNVFLLARHTYQPVFNWPLSAHQSSTTPPQPADITALVALDSTGQLLWQDQGWPAPWAISGQGRLYHRRGQFTSERDFFSINAAADLQPAGSLPFQAIDGHNDEMLLDSAGNLFAKFSSYNTGQSGGVAAFDADGQLLWNSYSEARDVKRGPMAIGPQHSLYYVAAPQTLVCIRP